MKKFRIKETRNKKFIPQVRILFFIWCNIDQRGIAEYEMGCGLDIETEDFEEALKRIEKYKDNKSRETVHYI